MTGPRAVFAACAAALLGCASNEPQPRIEAVDPAQAYTDNDIRLMLTGAGFVPSFHLDPVSGERVASMEGFSGRVSNQSNSAALTDFGWVSPTRISATLDIQDPDDLGVGPRNVEITDPRGQKAELPDGFVALGRYTFAPELTVTSPAAGDLYAPGATIHGEVTATDGPPGHLVALMWTYTEPPSVQRSPVTGDCPAGLRSDRIDCTFDLIISQGLDPNVTVSLDIVALDDSEPPRQSSPVDVPINLSQRPTVSSVTPQSGGVAGGTNVVLRGSGFIAGSLAYFGDDLLVPNGGIVFDSQTITGYTPAYNSTAAEAAVPVTVRSRLGSATCAYKFRYQAPPQIQSIVPSSGREGEYTWVQVYGANFTDGTVIYLGQTLADAVSLTNPSWINAGEIDGVVPPASGQAWVWAFDPANGWDRLPDQFFWTAP